ncbi:MAG: tripartite tricarboxylate transporter substrate binding protein [Acidaminococcus sp.]|uniref:tripartite tricarboxylate transporter substrate binding protein n=1 Tax=Acidaminococcus sp. TaxID=1872103 RepID=UPI003F169783
MKVKKWAAVLMTAAAALAVAGCGGSQTTQKSNGKQVKWPTKPVQVIVGFPAGGDSDYNARTMAKYLEKKLGKPFVVTNVTGTGSAIASTKVKNAQPDGNTVLFNHLALNVGSAAKTIDFSYKDFVMGGVAARAMGDAIVVRGDSPWNTLQDMIKDTQANPGKYRMPVASGGSTHWVAIALQNAGAKLNIVDSGGASDRVVSLLGGQADVIATSIPSIKDYLKTGQFKMLATTTSERVKEYPDVPTAKESGVDIAYYYNYTFFFPKGTDPAIAQKLNDAVQDIVKNDKDYAAEIKKAYMQDPFCMNIEDSNKYWSQEYDALMKISDKLQGKK